MFEDEIREALRIVESEEMKFIDQGLVEASMSKQEIESLLTHFADQQKIFKTLLDRCLLFEHGGMYRSRMAETVRLLRLIKQSFREQPVTSGKPLVADYRFVQKERRRPRLDTNQKELMTACENRSTVGRTILRELSFETMRRFQVTATLEILRSIDSQKSRAIVVAAGTGSGKTLAFYLPAMSFVAEVLEADQSSWTKILAIYPRNELLKDQFSSALKQTYDLRKKNLPIRPIRIGAWFGGTPSHPGAPNVWDANIGRDATFDLSTCPECDKKLVWKSADRVQKIERLRCTGTGCSCVIDSDLVALTRDSIKEKPVDILFTSSESLNRQIADSESFKAFGVNANNPLRMVLLDEVHTYEGTTGAQNAFLFRRLSQAVNAPLTWVALSATLANPRPFMSQLVGLPEGMVEVVEPSLDELESFGGEYLMLLKHDPTNQTSLLSLTIQTAMLMSRSLDYSHPLFVSKQTVSQGMFGKRIFLFTDKLDVTNRLYWSLLDAEGWSKPGRATSESPKSLAHLRTTTQDGAKKKENAALRDSDGQHWWMAESIGHLGKGPGKVIGRVSSQGKSDVDGSDIVVATSTLEVGVSDDGVGAVIQHKVPGSPAQYIQRKGRAGRQIEMRPWTIITVSEWGRDRLGWQLFEQTLDPQIEIRNLPLQNRHILKIQAAYATLDWLAQKLSGVGGFNTSAWSDLTAPAAVLYQGKSEQIKKGELRQRKAAELIREILEFGPEHLNWLKHVQESLAVDENEMNILMSSPPRPLLLGLLTTMYRRLSTKWEDEEPIGDEKFVKYRHPIREFAPSSLFADLMSNEVEITVPSGTRGASPDPLEESLPIARVIREFLPGNISRHFGHERYDRHWIPVAVPNPPGPIREVVDPRKPYGAIQIAFVPDENGNTISMFTPTKVNLELASEVLTDGSSVSPNWMTEISPLGEGQHINVDNFVTSQLILSGKSYLHNLGDGARIRRYVRTATGRVMGSTYGVHPLSIEFEVDDAPCAMGFEYEADALKFDVAKISKRDLKPGEVLDFVRETFEFSSDIPKEITYFERANLAQLCEAVSVEIRSNIDVGSSEITEDELKTLTKRIVNELDRLEIKSIVGDDDVTMTSVDELLSIAEVESVFREMVGVFLGVVKIDVTHWLQKRLASTISAALLESIPRISPTVDTDEIQIDISADGRTIWLSELDPGGNGHLEMIVNDLNEFSDLLGKIIRSQSLPGEIEVKGNELEKIVRIVNSDSKLLTTCQAIIDSWNLGHKALEKCLEDLYTQLQVYGVSVNPSLLGSLTGRFIGPGCSIASFAIAVAYMEFEEQIVNDYGFVPDLPTLQWLSITQMQSQLTKLAPHAVDEVGRLREIGLKSWPRNRNAARYDLVSSSRFERQQSADRHLIVELLKDQAKRIELDDVTLESVSEQLKSVGEVELFCDEDKLSELRAWIISTQSKPVEVNGLFVYPKVVGMTRENGKAIIRLASEEGIAW